MIPFKASKLYIVDGIEEDSFMRKRARRLQTGIRAEAVEHVGDAELNQAVKAGELGEGHCGMKAEIEPVVIFNRFRFHDSPEVQKERRERFPELFGKTRLSGYGGFDFRESGSPAYRKRTKLICQPAWQLHSIVGCVFRCAYCHLTHHISIMMNMEEFVERLDENIRKAPRQTLYQYDNYTDSVCFEPEYGASRLLVEYFAGRKNEYLELYVGKSDHVAHLLNLEHGGQTVCCWSVAGETQCTEIEYKSASMSDRIRSARLCQEAGYHVRFRLSPIVPVRNWRDENREMIDAIFTETRPDVITFETLRFLDYARIRELFDPELLDPEFLSIMEEAHGKEHTQGCQIPDAYREKVYRFIIDEIERVSPETPYSLCRGSQAMWDTLAGDFARHGQTPGNYVCNCGPTSAPGNELLRISA